MRREWGKYGGTPTAYPVRSGPEDLPSNNASPMVKNGIYVSGRDCAQNLKTQFVAVQPDVKLVVLDWGGTGRNLVLLAAAERSSRF